MNFIFCWTSRLQNRLQPDEHFFRRESRNVNKTCRILFYCLPCVNFVTFCLPLPRTSRSKTAVVPNHKHEMHTENQDQSSLLAEMPRPRTRTNVNIYFYSFLLQKCNWMMEWPAGIIIHTHSPNDGRSKYFGCVLRMGILCVNI